MPIHSKTNLYPGINAHLNSFLQQEGGDWEMFHAKHINVLQEYLDPLLAPNYYAVIEKSLQVTALPPMLDVPSRTRPDVAVFQRQPSASPLMTAPSEADAPVVTLPLADLLADDEFGYLAAVVYHMDGGHLPGQPVTRIEVMSPSNKPPKGDYQQYKARRNRTLRSGIVMVEIDYLHETFPTDGRLDNYALGEDGAYPYSITVHLPQPSPFAGKVYVYGVVVDQRLPRIDIPLAGDDTVRVDFNTVYNQTFERMVAFQLIVDYAADPMNFDRYTPDDQAKIRAILDAIRRERADE